MTITITVTMTVTIIVTSWFCAEEQRDAKPVKCM
jgi:hypothetical protein